MSSTIHSEKVSDKIRTDIIPLKPTFVDVQRNEITGWYFDSTKEIDLEAICFYIACGFFLGSDTYYRSVKVVEPATEVYFDNGQLRTKRYWQWHYSPRNLTLSGAVDEFSELFNRICSQDIKGRKIILPVSGGLDSRTQVVALAANKNIHAFSYEFIDGIGEVKYAKEITDKLRIPFDHYTIPRGYLWDVIDELANVTHCFSEFTHPRQMAVINELASLGDVFHLGHWGDVLFDNVGAAADVNFEQQLELLYAKVLKRGGFELGDLLWNAWGLHGKFAEALKNKLAKLLSEIQIEEPNARIRAFKSLYWASRWTSTNMLVFGSKKPVIAPYFHPEMLQFICTVPEQLLCGRKIQIEYIKRNNPAVASVPWQDYYPLNLYNYDRYYSFSHLPTRIFNKLSRGVNSLVNGNKKLNLRNWELQFLGPDNESYLNEYLYQNKTFCQFVPKEIVTDIYGKFKQESVRYSHPLSMLLTLSVFSSKHTYDSNS